MKRQMVSVKIRKDLIERLRKNKNTKGITITYQIEDALLGYITRSKFTELKD